ncbi:MAG TPA: putative collagen-binding domain-containing protein [Blastocatellia bacterium]|nr:putative collagen-binding domain-containing protein [Blastocatellia bacterium]
MDFFFSHNDLASTKYCLANPGNEYLVYLPEGDEATVDLSSAPGEFAVEWMYPVDGTITPGDMVKGGAKPNFAVPFSGAAVLYLRKIK